MSEEWKYDESSGSFRRAGGDGGYGGGKKNENDWIGWLVIAGMFAMGLWPIGLILLINKLKDDKPRRRFHTTPYHMGSAASAQAQTSGSAVHRTPQRERVSNAAQKVTKSPSDTSGSTKALRIIGAVLTAIGTVGLFTELGNIFSGAIDWSGLFYAIGFLSGGAVMFLNGRRMQQRRARIERYLAFMGNRDYVRIEELCMITGKKASVVEKDIDYMLQKKLLGAGAFFDAGHGTLFRSADAYQRYLQEQSKKENRTPKEVQEGYSGALRAIREANDAIPDPVFSEKLDRMEEIAGKIFKEVEAHPEKQKQASTFFDYYLPTTLKLLSTYTDFEEAGIEGENLRQAKSRIESIMGTLLENFEKQLDDLYRSEAMDVDSDIRVMESMLNRDLSSVERDFGLTLDGGTAVQSKPE